MSDLKLFRTRGLVQEIAGTSVAVERSLQHFFERNLDLLLGVRFLASEYSTGPVHGGRIDTIGIDENNSPVILEYKRATNENVINQGLYYLDWLLDHRAEFHLLVQQTVSGELAAEIDWTDPRLICVAGDYTKYDGHAVQQIHRHIELFRYRRYGEDLLLLELLNVSPSARTRDSGVSGVSRASTGQYKTFEEMLNQADRSLMDVYEALRAYVIALGEDVHVKRLKYYEAFKRIRNLACVTVQPQAKTVIVTVRVNPDTIGLEEGFTRDMRQIGHWGTGDLEITLRSLEDLERAKSLLNKAYDQG